MESIDPYPKEVSYQRSHNKRFLLLSLFFGTAQKASCKSTAVELGLVAGTPEPGMDITYLGGKTFPTN